MGDRGSLLKRFIEVEVAGDAFWVGVEDAVSTVDEAFMIGVEVVAVPVPTV